MNHTIRVCVEWSLLILIAVRPTLDVWTDTQLPLIGLNPASVASLYLIIAGGVWFVNLSKEERRRVVSIPMVQLFALWILLLLPWAVTPWWMGEYARFDAVKEWIRIVSYLPLVMILIVLAAEGKSQHIVNALLVSAAAPACVGMYQLLFGQGEMIQGVHRIQGTFVHPNPFSFYLVVLMGVTYWKWRWSSHKIGWTILFAIEWALLIATFSFTGAGMFAVTVLICALSEHQRLRRWILTASILFGLVFLLSPTGRHRIHTVTQWDSLDEIERTGRETSSMVWRLLNWRFLYRVWTKSPLVGYGLDSAPVVNPNKVDHGKGPGQDPHNDYIRFLVDTGAIGFVLFLWWLGRCGRLLIYAYKSSIHPPSRHLIAIALALYASWLAGMMNDNLFTATAYQYCWWAVCSAAIGWRMAEDRLFQQETKNG